MYEGKLEFPQGGGFTEQTPYMGRATHFILV